jgi:hypothetical protein
LVYEIKTTKFLENKFAQKVQRGGESEFIIFDMTLEYKKFAP